MPGGDAVPDQAAGIPLPMWAGVGLARLHADLSAALARVEDMGKKVKVTERGRVGRQRRQEPVSSEARE
jgi:hypothetical protein